MSTLRFFQALDDSFSDFHAGTAEPLLEQVLRENRELRCGVRGVAESDLGGLPLRNLHIDTKNGHIF